MALLRPDSTFYPSPRLAMQGPPERLAYVAALNPPGGTLNDAILVIDVDPASANYGKRVGQTVLPNVGDELHHFGWNACSSALCPYAPHPHIERRYLVVPGIRSSRIYVLDIKPDPRNPSIVKIIEPEELFERTGYSRPHTVHCGPEGIYISALGAPDGNGPAGIFLLDHFTFEVLGKWEMDRGSQYLGYDFWWHITQDTLLTSEWGTPNQIENGVIPEELLQGRYGHQVHVWDLRKRRHVQALDLGKEYQMVLEMRPAHDPTKTYGFAGVVVSLKDLSASIWLWHRQDGAWQIEKVIEIPAEPADPEKLPPLLKGFKAVPPFVTDIVLSINDRFLYVSCWGTGEMLQYDVSDPFHPKRTGSVHIGGMVRQTPHLARLSTRPLQVTVINYRRPAGRGVAYGTRRPEHLLNVAARNMSAFRDEPDHFLRWLRTRSEFDTMPEIELRERFMPRMVYGDYLRSIMHHHLQSAGGMTPITTEFVAGEVLDIEPAGDTAVVRLTDSTAVEADRVVLATGNEPPAALPGSPQVRVDGIYFQSLRYISTTLAADVGETVTLRFDPRDMAEIRVFHEDRVLVSSRLC